MARKLIIDLDPGIGDAVAAVLALLDPEFDLLALTATAGSVPGDVATRNLHGIVAQVDPPKWPRIGSAPSGASLQRLGFESQLDALHGSTGLGDVEIFAPELHHRHESSKVLIDSVRAHPQEVTLLTLGPLTNVAAACERAPDFMDLLGGLVCLGGSVAAGGDLTAAAETNVYLNPEAARTVLAGPYAKTLIPLDATNATIVTYETFTRLVADLVTFFAEDNPCFLPAKFRAACEPARQPEPEPLCSRKALAAVARPGLCRLQSLQVDVEVQAGLTSGVTVFERRPHLAGKTNASVALEVDSQGVVDYMTQLLR